MSTSLNFPLPAKIVIRSQFLTASDVLTAKKRQLVARSYFQELQTSRNLRNKYASLIPTAVASDKTIYRDDYYQRQNVPLSSGNGCCIPNLISVSRPPTYVSPPRLDLKPYA